MITGWGSSSGTDLIKLIGTIPIPGGENKPVTESRRDCFEERVAIRSVPEHLGVLKTCGKPLNTRQNASRAFIIRP